MGDDRSPVLIGVGQLAWNRKGDPTGGKEPLELILDATRRAAADAGLETDALARIDDFSVVNVLSWAYEDLARSVAGRLGASPHHALHSDLGGNRPVELVDQAAGRIASGESRLALVCGGEAMASMVAASKAGVDPGWSKDPGGLMPPSPDVMATELMIRYELVLPIRTYPMYENALRAARGETFAESQRWSAELWSAFSRVAAGNEATWDRQEHSAAEILSPDGGNRMICFPYPRLMNARMQVDQGAAVLLTGRTTATELGVPPDRMVHLWSGAAAKEPTDMLARQGYDESPGMRTSLNDALERAGLTAGEIDVFDLYACFPVVPKLASIELELAPDADMTATGGLTSFGGPVNDYSLHSVVAVAERLRNGAKTALVYGNGEFVGKHHTIVLGADAAPGGFQGHEGPIPELAGEAPETVESAIGPATIETYTVEYDRGGEPTIGYVIGRLNEGGGRFLAHAHAPETIAALVDEQREAVGRAIDGSPGPDGLNRVEIKP